MLGSAVNPGGPSATPSQGAQEKPAWRASWPVAMMFTVRTDDLVLALDIGGTHATAAVVSIARHGVVDGTLMREAVDAGAPAAVLLEAWADVCRRAHAGAGRPALVGIGVAMPGPFDYEAGIGKARHKLAALKGVDVREELRARLLGHADETPVRFGNDAAVFTLGEWWAGAARGAARVLGVTLGTGLGSGFVADGRLLEEGDAVAPEGQIWWTPYRDGVAEDYVSARAITAAYARRGGRTADAEAVAAAASRGDGRARDAYGDFGHDLGAVLSKWVERFGPEVLVLGGNIARSWHLFAQAFDDSLDAPRSLRIAVTAAYEQSSLLGVAALVSQEW